nr:MAG TPA: hypothetical protein [Caudoviricetes sp.]
MCFNAFLSRRILLVKPFALLLLSQNSTFQKRKRLNYAAFYLPIILICFFSFCLYYSLISK